MEDIDQLQDLIDSTLPAFQVSDATDASVLQFLLDKGTDPALARQVVTFVPLAFGRAVLSRLPVVLSTTYSTMDDQNKFTEGILLELEPVFVAAQWLAEELIEQYRWRDDQHLLLAMWSAEFKSVNSLLSNGSKPENLEVSAPVLLWDMVGSTPMPKTGRPWWKFW